MSSSITYTPEQEAAMLELRRRTEKDLPPEMYEDLALFYRFLKARNFHMGQAESMLRKHLEFRKGMQIDTIIEDYEPPEVVKKYYPTSFIGLDKEGCVVRIIALGNTDGKGLRKSANRIHFLKYAVKNTELDLRLLKQQVKKFGKFWMQNILILDLEHITLAKITDKSSVGIYLKEVSNFQDNYPELLKSIYIINASVYFEMVFPVFKAILVGPIMEKIKVFGRNGWKEEFRKIIDPDVLPACLGGNRRDPDGDPTCRSTIPWGGIVPERYYVTKDTSKFAKESGVKKINIPRSSSVEVKHLVKNPNTLLEWEYIIENHDIGVKILFEDPLRSRETTEIVSLQFFETEVDPLKGKLKCKEPGTYIIVFSNKHSWLSSKDVFYRTWLTNISNKKENI